MLFFLLLLILTGIVSRDYHQDLKHLMIFKRSDGINTINNEIIQTRLLGISLLIFSKGYILQYPERSSLWLWISRGSLNMNKRGICKHQKNLIIMQVGNNQGAVC